MKTEDEIIRLAKQLIQIPYINNKTKDVDKATQLIQLIKQQLPNYPATIFTANNIPSLLISNTNTETKKFKIILNAHLDVVAGTDEQYNPIEKDGKLYGRGAYDMKTAAAVMTQTFKEISRKVSYPLGLQIVTDEETTGLNGTGYQIQQGIKAEFVIAGEGTNLRIIHKAKTRVVLKLTAKGKSSHGAYPWLGDNAITKIQRSIFKILTVYPTPEEETTESTVNVTYIATTNQTYNKTPAYCEAILDIRHTPKDKNIVKKIQELVLPGVICEVIKASFPHQTDPKSIYIKTIQKNAKKIFGKELKLAQAHGTSDITHYAKIGCQGIELGPQGAGLHSNNEWVDIKSVHNYHQLLKAFLLDIDHLQQSPTSQLSNNML